MPASPTFNGIIQADRSGRNRGSAAAADLPDMGSVRSLTPTLDSTQKVMPPNPCRHTGASDPSSLITVSVVSGTVCRIPVFPEEEWFVKLTERFGGGLVRQMARWLRQQNACRSFCFGGNDVFQ